MQISTFEALPYSHSLHICRSPLLRHSPTPLFAYMQISSATTERVPPPALALCTPSLSPYPGFKAACAFSRPFATPPLGAHSAALRPFFHAPTFWRLEHSCLVSLLCGGASAVFFVSLSRSHTISLCATSRRRRRGRCLSCPRKPPTRRCVSSRMARGVCFG